MSPKEFENEMQKILDLYEGDTQATHTAMDNLMCENLRLLGYEAGVEIFKNTHKWYS
jgi:hypothetical protein